MKSLLPDGMRDRIVAAMARCNPTILRVVADSLSRIYAPACALNCWQWAQANIVLLPEESRDHHGPYDSSTTIYVRRMMEFVTNPHEREFIPRKSSQLGFTLAYLLIVCYFAATRPTHVLYAMDSAKEARNISERLKRLLTTNEALTPSFLGDGEDELSNLLLKLRGMTIYMGGSGAKGLFANKSVGLCILDELDLHLPTAEGGLTIDRARERLKKVAAGKLIAGGKPEAYNGETNLNYLTGSRDQIYLPCPHCGDYQTIEFERLRFDHCKDLAGDWDLPKVLAETYCECANTLCRQPIREHHKPAMLAAYECRRTNHGQDDHKPYPGRVSMWINDLILAHDPKNTWGHIAAQFIDAQSSDSKLVTFFNGVLALPRKERGQEITRSAIDKLAGAYRHGCMPVTPAIDPATGSAAIGLFTDVQGTVRKWSKIGFTCTGEAFVIDYGQELTYEALLAEAAKPVWTGTLAEPPDEKELDALRERCLADGTSYHEALRAAYPDRPFHTVSGGLIDEGHETFVVRDFCHSTGDSDRGLDPLFFPSKGISKVHAIELVSEIRDKFRTAKEADAPYITAYHYSDDDLKRALYIDRIARFDAIKSGESQTPRLWLPAYTEDHYKAELMAERLGEVRHRGKLRMMWIDPTTANDYGDTVKMGLAWWHVVRAYFPAPAQEEAA